MSRVVQVALAIALAAGCPAGATPPSMSASDSFAQVVRSANRKALQEPVSTSFVNAVQLYPFTEGGFYRLYTAPEHVSDIVLEPGEQLGAVAAGDTARWIIGDTTSGSGDAKRVHILVKPVRAGLATNLVITTDRRTYHLALASAAGPAMVAVRWAYAADALLAVKANRADTPPVVSPALERLDFGYRIRGDRPRWRPDRVFDDGRQTFIEFPAALSVSEAPPLFAVDVNGAAQLVNFRQAGRFYVVDRLFDHAELRLGTKRATVVRIVRDIKAGRGE